MFKFEERKVLNCAQGVLLRFKGPKIPFSVCLLLHTLLMNIFKTYVTIILIETMSFYVVKFFTGKTAIT